MPDLKRNRPTIGVLAGWQTYTGTIHSFLDYVFRGIQAAAHDFDCNLLIGCSVSSTNSDGTDNIALPMHIPGSDFIPVGPWNTDGLLVVPPLVLPGAMEYFEQLIADGFPLVFAGDRQTGPAVVVDNEDGIRQAVDHLVDHGHKRIAFIAGFDTLSGDSAQRLNGYLSGLQAHGLEYDPDLVAYGLNTSTPSYQAMMEILSRGKPFTSVIGSNDEGAIGAMNALRDSGLIVPQDVAVIGFDDRLEARAQIPLLTTVRHPMFELGYQSLELACQIIADLAPRDTFRSIPTHLVIRESCGCLPGAEYGYHHPAASQPAAVPAPTTNGNKSNGAPAAAPRPGAPLHTSGDAAEEKSSGLIGQAMSEVVYKEMQRLSRKEVEYLCYRLVDALKLSLTHGSANTFRQAIQQILEHVAKVGDDLYAWQGAISVLKEWTPILLDSLPYSLPACQLENMLHQARVAISEVSRGQYSRLLVGQTDTANQIGQMTSRFLTAQSEKEIFEILNQTLIALDIPPAVVALYETEGEDPAAGSLLKSPTGGCGCEKRFVTRQFPPPGMYPDDRPYQAAVLPLVLEKGVMGFAAFSTHNLEPLGSIVRQLMAALRGVFLLQEAVEARRIAEEAQQIAEEANNLKSRFLSMVSHELRTPLNLIIGLSNMMLEESEPYSAEECLANRKDLERIYIGAQHLESLMRDVLDLARSDVGQLKLVRETLDVHEVLETVSTIGEELARNKDLAWKFTIPDQLPKIRGDRARLRQILLNLVNNAIKFTSEGTVSLSCSLVDDSLVIAVEDTGLGIPPDEQCAIFDEFHQSKRTSARGFGGLGLGLAICRRLVEMHGGQIGVSSSGEEGAGSTFFLGLPILEPAAPAVEFPASAFEGERVLLLVKDLGSSENLKNHLTGQGFVVETHCVDPSTDWMTWLQPIPPDKVILDLGLTSERGWEIMRMIKETPATRDVPVLFYALKNEEDSGSLLDLDLLTKPIRANDLTSELVKRGLFQGKEKAALAKPVLVVDDDPGILEMHTRVVESMGLNCRVLQARDGSVALEIIRAEHPGLVLLDLMMPNVDGFTVLERMQSEDLLRGTTVIVLSGQALTEEDMARLNCRAASVLGKGMFSAQETMEHIAAVLSRKRRLGNDTQRMVLKALAYLNTHYKDSISRSDIATHIGVSERHLARCFQQEVGVSPITYLNRLRVKVARDLLDAGQMSITDVAMEVGFSAGGYFTRVFRDEVGISPRDYIRSRGSG